MKKKRSKKWVIFVSLSVFLALYIICNRKTPPKYSPIYVVIHNNLTEEETAFNQPTDIYFMFPELRDYGFRLRKYSGVNRIGLTSGPSIYYEWVFKGNDDDGDHYVFDFLINNQIEIKKEIVVFEREIEIYTDDKFSLLIKPPENVLANN